MLSDWPKTMRCSELPPRFAVYMLPSLGRWIRCQRPFPTAVGELIRYAR